MTSNPGDQPDDNPWSPERYAEAWAEEQANKRKGPWLSMQAKVLIFGVLLGVGITLYGIYLAR